MPSLEPRPVAITIVGGFLGSGKTTLINRLVRGLEGVPTAVLINDFGSAVVDAGQVVGVEGEVVRLANGCICCTMQNGVTSTLLSVLERTPGIRHVLIETSGIADPRAVAEPVRALERLGGFRLDGIVNVADAENFDLSGEHGGLLRAQLVTSDVVVLNKVDLVSAERLAEVGAQIRGVAGGARVLESIEADVPVDVLLAVEADTKRLDGIPVLDLCAHAGEHRHAHPPAHGFATHTSRLAGPLSWMTLAPLLKTLAPAIYRVKGVLSLVERPGDRLLLHVVGTRVYVRTIEPWGTAEPYSELVMIGRASGFDPAELDAKIRACASR